MVHLGCTNRAGEGNELCIKSEVTACNGPGPAAASRSWKRTKRRDSRIAKIKRGRNGHMRQQLSLGGLLIALAAGSCAEAGLCKSRACFSDGWLWSHRVNFIPGSRNLKREGTARCFFLLSVSAPLSPCGSAWQVNSSCICVKLVATVNSLSLLVCNL